MTSTSNEKLNGSCHIGMVSDSNPSKLDAARGWWIKARRNVTPTDDFVKSKQQIFKAVWPHVLLIILLVLYVVGGAIAFLYLEHPTEVRLKREGTQLVQQQKLRLQQFVWSSLIASSSGAVANTSASRNDSSSSSLLKVATFASITNMSDPSTEDEVKWREHFDEALAEYTKTLLRAAKENFLEMSTLFESTNKAEDLWTFPAAVLFAFSAVTTIGYGNISPITFHGRLFCIFYGLVGIPFAMLVLTNVGKFLSEALQHAVLFSKKLANRSLSRILVILRRLKKKPDAIMYNNNNPREDISCSLCGLDEEKKEEEDGTAPVDQPLPFVCLIGLVFLYICLGAILLPMWESLSFFDAFYFNFVTITTTGFGDVVPQRYTFIAVTLAYVGIGIAMATMCIEAASAYMRKLHYVGRRIQGAKFAMIRFGDKEIRLDDMMTLFGLKMGVSAMEMSRLKTKLDAFVATAIEAKKMNDEEKVTAITNFDLQQPDDIALTNGSVLLDEKEDTKPPVRPPPIFVLDIPDKLRCLRIGPFNVSCDDIRYIDDDDGKSPYDPIR